MTDTAGLAQAYRSLKERKEHLQKEIAQINSALKDVSKAIGEYMVGTGNTSLQLTENDILVLKTVEKSIPVPTKEHREKLKQILWELGITNEDHVNAVINAKKGDVVQHQKLCVIGRDGKRRSGTGSKKSEGGMMI